MICCLESPCADAESSYYAQVATDEIPLDKQANKTSAGALYPGLRRKPHGPPPNHPISNDMIGNHHHHHHNSYMNTNDNGLISVTVPPGVLPGQEIHVRRPDGTNGLVEVVVPPGMKEGSIFHVKAPPPSPPPLVEEESRNPEQQYQPPVTTNDPKNSTCEVVANDDNGESCQQGDFANCLDNTTGSSSIASANKGKGYQ